jgi:uncharacterized protein (UPF0128 family)
MVGKEPEHEDKVKIIKDLIKEHGEEGKSISYKELQNLCAELFEGVRLVLKRMKGEGHIDFDGMIPGFASIITLK